MKRQLNLVMAGAAFIATTGCLQIDTTVKMEPDGSATVTERVRVAKVLLDLDAQHKGKGPTFAQLLGREAALKQAEQMGGGVKVVSHKVGPAEKGARECVTVFKRPTLDGLEYMSPLLAHYDYPTLNRIRFKVSPMMASRPYGMGEAGNMLVRVLMVDASGKTLSAVPSPQGQTGTPSPRDVQIFRELAPVFRDLMKDFHVRLCFATYGPTPTCYKFRPSGYAHGPRNARAGTNLADLLDLSHEDLDQFGGKFLENEEIMLAVVRGDPGAEPIYEAVKNCVGNTTLPFFLTAGSGHPGSDRQSMQFWFPPARPLFDKHFAGKDLDFRKGRKRHKGVVPAQWEDIGYRPSKRK